tara:strand:- start:117 stop:392 length:276 start_codon:yes stop_codon:yes gene_type:complete
MYRNTKTLEIMTTQKFTTEKTYDKGYGYTRVYTCGNFNIQREGLENEFGGWEDKGNWVILYKGNMFDGVTGTLPTLKIAKSVVATYLKMGY